MPYTSITTRADGDILTAAHLNTLSANQEFLHGLANRANPPFNSYRIAGGTINRTTMVWFSRYRVDYFHWKIETTSVPTYMRVYYNDNKVYGDEAPVGLTWTGQIDHTDFSAYPNLSGAWSVAAVAYEDDYNGSGDDGEIVSHGGAYYKCILSHTSGASTEPGVGASWTTNWVLLSVPTVGDLVDAHVVIDSGGTITIEYLIETDSAAL